MLHRSVCVGVTGLLKVIESEVKVRWPNRGCAGQTESNALLVLLICLSTTLIAIVAIACNMANPYQPASYAAWRKQRAETQAEQAELQKYPVRAVLPSKPTGTALGVARDSVYPRVRRTCFYHYWNHDVLTLSSSGDRLSQ